VLKTVTSCRKNGESWVDRNRQFFASVGLYVFIYVSGKNSGLWLSSENCH